MRLAAICRQTQNANNLRRVGPDRHLYRRLHDEVPRLHRARHHCVVSHLPPRQPARTPTSKHNTELSLQHQSISPIFQCWDVHLPTGMTICQHITHVAAYPCIRSYTWSGTRTSSWPNTPTDRLSWTNPKLRESKWKRPEASPERQDQQILLDQCQAM